MPPLKEDKRLFRIDFWNFELLEKVKFDSFHSFILSFLALIILANKETKPVPFGSTDITLIEDEPTVEFSSEEEESTDSKLERAKETVKVLEVFFPYSSMISHSTN